MTKSNTPKPGNKTPKTPSVRNSDVGTPKKALNKSINKTPKLPNTPSGDSKIAQQTPKLVKQNLNTPKNQKTPRITNTPVKTPAKTPVTKTPVTKTPVTKTPAKTPAKTPVTKNKTPKAETLTKSPGLQLKKKSPASQNGAKTPNGVKATPQKRNQTPAKAPTSQLNGKGKTPVKNLIKQTPKGTPGNKKTPVSSKKAVIKTEESDDEDDDDEEDEDIEMEEMENDDDSLDEDDDDDDDDDDEDDDDEDDAVGDNIRNTILDKYLKMAAEEDDEDEDDEDDDDEEDEDDDEDEDEDIKGVELLKVGQKRKSEENQKTTPIEPKAKVAKDAKLTAIKDKAAKTEPKAGEKRKGENEGPKAKVSKPDEKQKQKEKLKKVVKEEKIDPEQEKKNRKILFIKNLPQEVTVDEIKALSKDIQDVHLRKSHFKLGKKSWFAFLFFTSETVTEKNHKLISGKKLHDKDVVVDFVGEKSKNKKLSKYSSDYELDPLKLYVTGFDETCTEKDLKKMFPKCENIHMPKRKKGALHGFAFIFFGKPGDAQQGLKTNGKKIKENVLVVLQGKKTKAKVNQKTLKDLKAKKQAEKATVAVDDEDDDDDDDESEDDEIEDDEEEEEDADESDDDDDDDDE